MTGTFAMSLLLHPGGYVNRVACLSLLWISCAATLASAQEANLVRLPQSALLLKSTRALYVTTPSETSLLQEFLDWRIEPTMSRDGLVIASAHSIPNSEYGVIVGVYSGRERKWIELKRAEKLHSKISVAPDGSQIAFAQLYEFNPRKSQIHVIDVQTREEAIFPLEDEGGEDISWSPDSRRIIYTAANAPVFITKKYAPEVEILDINTGTRTKLADGHSPVWSPAGDRILYFHSIVQIENYRNDPDAWVTSPGRTRLMQVRPDGTDSRALMTIPKIRFLGILFAEEGHFWGSMIFSPDGNSILLNQNWNYSEGHRFDTYLIDLRTMKMKRKFRKAPLVFGWIEGS